VATVGGTLTAAFCVGVLIGGYPLLHGAGPGPSFRLPGMEYSVAAPSPSPRATPTPTPAPVTATASRHDGGWVISGVVQGAGSGEPVQVQYKSSGSWQDFPANARTGSGGHYTVNIRTSDTDRRFRTRAGGSGNTSEPFSLP
jgi:hypothetical protein